MKASHDDQDHEPDESIGPSREFMDGTVFDPTRPPFLR